MTARVMAGCLAVAVALALAAPAEAREAPDPFDLFEEYEGPPPSPPREDQPAEDNDEGVDPFDVYEDYEAEEVPREPDVTEPDVVTEPEPPRADWFGERFTFVHNLRVTAALLQHYDFEPFFDSRGADGLSNLSYRLGLEDRPTRRFAYKLHVEQRIFFSTVAEAVGTGLLLAPGVGDVRYRGLDLTWTWAEEQQLTASLVLDWGHVMFSERLGSTARHDITLGRQPITFGVARLWNPLDEFFAFDPRQIDTTYKPGVDALRLDLSLGSHSGVTIVAAAGRTIGAAGTYESSRFADADFYGSAVLARVHGQPIKGWDAALQGGKVYGGYQTGASLIGEVDDLQLYVEGYYFFAQGGGPRFEAPLGGEIAQHHLQFVAGVTWYLDADWQLTLEYLFNGIADPNDPLRSLARVQLGWTRHLSRHVIGAHASYIIDGNLTANLVALVAPQDPSLQVQPLLTVLIGDDVSLVVGALLNAGRRPVERAGSGFEIRSEFGTFSNMFFAQIEIHF